MKPIYMFIAIAPIVGLASLFFRSNRSVERDVIAKFSTLSFDTVLHAKAGLPPYQIEHHQGNYYWITPQGIFASNPQQEKPDHLYKYSTVKRLHIAKDRFFLEANTRWYLRGNYPKWYWSYVSENQGRDWKPLNLSLHKDHVNIREIVGLLGDVVVPRHDRFQFYASSMIIDTLTDKVFVSALQTPWLFLFEKEGVRSVKYLEEPFHHLALGYSDEIYAVSNSGVYVSQDAKHEKWMQLTDQFSPHRIIPLQNGSLLADTHKGYFIATDQRNFKRLHFRPDSVRKDIVLTGSTSNGILLGFDRINDMAFGITKFGRGEMHVFYEIPNEQKESLIISALTYDEKERQLLMVVSQVHKTPRRGSGKRRPDCHFVVLRATLSQSV